MRRGWRALLLFFAAGLAAPAMAQPIDMSHGGPVEITARDGLDWHQNEQMVVARGDARAVRGDVTVLADRLIAYYRHKAGPAGPAPAVKSGSRTAPGAPGDETGNSEIYRLEAVGSVRIYTPTDHATADHAVYDIDQAVLILTGHDLRLVTPQQVITARDSLEYWSGAHMAVARGNAVITTTDARQLSADTVVGYLSHDDTKKKDSGEAAARPAAKPEGQAKAAGEASGNQNSADQQSGKLERAEAFGHVVMRTPTQTVRGDRGVYLPPSGLARLTGNAQLTQGANQVHGADLLVDLNTGIYRLLSAPGQRVEGLVTPNDSGAPPGAGAAPPPPAKSSPTAPGRTGTSAPKAEP